MIPPERLVALPVEVDGYEFTGFGQGGNGYDLLDTLHGLGVPADRDGENIRMQTTEREASTAFPRWTVIVGTEYEVYPISPKVRAKKYRTARP